MQGKTTLAEMYWPLMHLPPDVVSEIENADRCVICGRLWPLNRHHIVPRSAGELYEDGEKLNKACIVLCGSGNNLRDANGRMYCHGRAHHKMLHFRNDRGRLEFAEFDEPTDYMKALESGWWEPLDRFTAEQKIIDHYAALREATFERGIYYDDWEDE